MMKDCYIEIMTECSLSWVTCKGGPMERGVALDRAETMRNDEAVRRAAGRERVALAIRVVRATEPLLYIPASGECLVFDETKER